MLENDIFGKIFKPKEEELQPRPSESVNDIKFLYVESFLSYRVKNKVCDGQTDGQRDYYYIYRVPASSMAKP